MTSSQEIAAFIRPIAHRGLHDAGAGIIENTAAAFEAATGGRYGIECDLRPASDGTPMVFHDDTLDRLMNGAGAVSSYSQQELQKFRYSGAENTNEMILSFAGLLEMVAGSVPLMVEIKNEWQEPYPGFLEKIAKLAQSYNGPIALKSFDPGIMIAIRKLAPGIPRGIVAGKYRGDGWWADQLGLWRRFSLTHLLSSTAVRPSFISYHVGDLPTLATITARNVFRLPIFAWTVRTPEDRAIVAKWADAPIFEGYRP